MYDHKFVDPKTEDLISKLAQDETGKRQYYRPVYSLHKWWARRPGALFRSIILQATQPEKPLFQLNGNGTLSAASNYFDSHDLSHVTILDPFMGGGTTLVEANRLGAKVIGCDLNPVSYWIVREALKPLDLTKLDQYFSQLEQTAGEKIKSLYKTNCSTCTQPADTMYSFWVRYIACPQCGENVYLFKRTLLNKGLSRNKPMSVTNPATTFCPHCFALNDWTGKDLCTCTACGQAYDPQQGSYDQGYYACGQCHTNGLNLIKTLGSEKQLKEKLIALEYLCPCNNTRTYKSPDAEDLAQIKQIEAELAALWSDLAIPRQLILEGASSARWLNHNYRHYYEVFNARQLLAFHYLLEGIQEIAEEEYQYAFITAFSNCLEYNNMMTPYNYPHRKLHHLFNYHAMPLTTTPVENAVWGVGKEGAGTFTNCYRRYVRAKKYCQQPYDKFKDTRGNVYTAESKQEKIEANFVTSFANIEDVPRGALLLCGDSAHLPEIPDKSVDFVITDPPYFDSIHYSELSNFFYVWLRTAVPDQHFVLEHVPTDAEAIVNQGMDKGEAEYQALLGNVFQECGRVLKDDGKLIFTFHHTKWRAWWTVLEALAQGGFWVVDSFPAMSEYKVNPHIRNKQALDMDLVLVCQKLSISRPDLPTAPARILQRTTNRLNGNELGSNDNKLFLYFMGELLKTASSARENEAIHYDWFAEALTHFDDYLDTIDRAEINEQYNIQPYQLRLLETEKGLSTLNDHSPAS
jgi:putative DNA methylase